MTGTATSAPYAPRDLDALCRFASTNAAARPHAVYLMPGDIVWRDPSLESVRLWRDERGLAGFAWFEPPTGVEFDLRHDLSWDGAVATSMLDWAEAERARHTQAYPRFVDLDSMDAWRNEVLHPRPPHAGDGRWLTATAFEDDTSRVAALNARGYRPTRHFAPHYRFDLPAIPSRTTEAALPEGARVRHVTEDDLDERVATHRDAWVGSAWTLERYAEIRASNTYEATLDLVVEVPGGEFACCCIAWADEASGIGSFEPVGARPAWRGRGVTRAMILEGFGRLRERGMSLARVETAGFNAPAQALYERCGFERSGTLRTFILEVT